MSIKVIEAAEHNLKNISCEIDEAGITVITGPSGAGKTSLAIDTVYAESCYRIESVKAFLGIGCGARKPAVKAIQNLPQVLIAKGKERLLGHTVASYTKLDNALYELFLKYGKRHCPKCNNGLIQVTTRNEAASSLGVKSDLCAVCAVLQRGSLSIDDAKKLLERAITSATTYCIYQDKVFDFDDDAELLSAAFLNDNAALELIVDRLNPKQDKKRLKQAIDAAESIQNGGVVTRKLDSNGEVLIEEDTEKKYFTENGICNVCGYQSFNLGAAVFDFRNIDKREIAILSKEEEKEFFAYTLAGISLGDLTQLSIVELHKCISSLEKNKIIERILTSIEHLGVGYLSLDRTLKTLSHGELQRIQLATGFEKATAGSLLVLDEPTLGLHPKDIKAFVTELKNIKKRGIGILAVEHDSQVIEAADKVITLGPGAGKAGGEIVDASREFFSAKKLPTRDVSNSWIYIKSAKKYNLKNIDIKFPMGRFSCVSGVSGSGKSTLIFETLLPALTNKGNVQAEVTSDCDIKRVVAAAFIPDKIKFSASIANFVRLNLPLRDFFSLLPLSKVKGVSGKDFSELKAEAVKYHGFSFGELLNMSASEVLPILGVIPKCKRILDLLIKFKLDYLPLSQSLSTVSLGELQRLHLVREFGRSSEKALYLFDEPSSCLSNKESYELGCLFREFTELGNTIIAIDHKESFLKTADYVYELGPVGGPEGGYIVKNPF